MSATTGYVTVRDTTAKRRYVIDYLGERPDGREQWGATCGCGWWGSFISHRAARLAVARHRHLDAAALWVCSCGARNRLRDLLCRHCGDPKP